MLIGLSEDKTPIDFLFTRSKVKVTSVFFVKQWFPLIILINIYHRAIIFHMLIGLSDAMTPYDFGFTGLKVKVTMVPCKKYVHMLSDHYLENYLPHSKLPAAVTSPDQYSNHCHHK